MINYIKSLFTIRPEIEQVAERLGEGEVHYNLFTGVDRYKIPNLAVCFFCINNQVYDFTVDNIRFPITKKEKKCISKALQKLEKQREDEKVQKAYSLLKSNLEKK